MIDYAEFRQRSSFNAIELLAFAHGTLIDDPPDGFACRLPMPPMLMFDRVVELERDRNRGRAVAEKEVRIDDWFFQCHFSGDPVQPGCLGVDAVWQLIGFFCAWNGAIGSGRALGCGEISFEGQIRPHNSIVRYEVDIRRFSDLPSKGAALAVGDASVLVDGEPIYSMERAKVGVFRDLAYDDYPAPSPRSRGGRMEGRR